MIKVSSKVKLNMAQINLLERAQVVALEQTAEALHAEVTQAQVFPRDTGHLQDESTFIDYSQSNQGKVTIVSSTPYARRLYDHLINTDIICANILKIIKRLKKLYC